MPVFNKYPIIINYLFILQVETFYCQPFSQRTMTLFKNCVVGFCMLFVFVICLYSFVVPIQYKVWIYNYLLLQNNSRVGMSDVIDVNQTESLMGTKIPNMTNHLKSVQTDFYHVPHSEFYLYKESAFVIKEGTEITVIIFGFVGNSINDTFFCTCLFDQEHMVTVKGTVKKIYKRAYNKYHPVIYKCPLGNVTGLPEKLAISKGTDISNTYLINVLDRRRHTVAAKDGVAVCVKSMYRVTSPRWFTEWMEMQRLMGAQKVIFYGEKETGRDVKKLLDYYKTLGFLHLQPWNNRLLSTVVPNQFASNNDCLYRFGYLFRYMVYIDLDEVIVPTNATNERKTYQDIINIYNSTDVLSFRHTHFCVPGYVQQRNESVLSGNTFIYSQAPISRLQKCIIKPSYVSLMGIHVAFKYFRPETTKSSVSPDVAKLHHYRFGKFGECQIKDTSLSVYHSGLTKRVSKVLRLNGIQ